MRYDLFGNNHQTITHFPWDGGVICPPAEDEFTRHIRFPHRLGELKSAGNLLQEIDAFLCRCLDLDDRHRFLLACFVLASWLVDRLPVAPYIAFVGLPQSGKSTALKTLQLLCRRGLITSDISSAAFYRACERLQPTLFIDETATAGQTRVLFHLLRSGTTRDAVAFRNGESYRAFGTKAVAWRELPDDDALNSRCIVIPMRETSRTDIMRTTHPEIVEAADKLQGQLMRFRFEKTLGLRLPQIPGADRLRSRDRDLYESLALPIGEDLAASARLLECLASEHVSTREPLPPDETAVVETLFEQIHLHPDQGNYAIRHLTHEVNANLARSAERFRLNGKAVGAVLTTLGFRHRKRTNLGFVVWLDRDARKRIHELMSTYGMDAPSAHLPAAEPNEPCDLCMGEQLQPDHLPSPEINERCDQPEDDDLQCPDAAPAGRWVNEPETENGAAEEPTSHNGERSEHGEREKSTARPEWSEEFLENDETLREEVQRIVRWCEDNHPEEVEADLKARSATFVWQVPPREELNPNHDDDLYNSL
jgi:hypothetical protein